MLKITRKTEYALMALQHLAKQPAGETVSVAEIARRCRIPEVLLAKVLQRLKRHGLLTSTQGAAGGYALARDPSTLSLVDFFHIFEEQTALVDCMVAEPVGCNMFEVCEIKGPLAALNELLHRQLRQLTLGDVVLPSPTVSARTEREPSRLSIESGQGARHAAVAEHNQTTSTEV